MTRHVRCWLLALGVMLAGSAALQADEQSLAEVRAKAVCKYLSNEWITVLHVDVARLELEPFFGNFIEPLVGSLEPDRVADGKKQANQFVEGFVKAGGKDLYIIGSGRPPVAPAPFMLVPMPPGSDEQGMKALLDGAKPEVVERLDDMLYAGTRANLERLRAQKAAPAAELTRAFAAAGDTTAQFIFMPTDEDRQIIEALVPMLPARAGGGPVAPLTRGCSWIALGVDAPPKMTFRLVVQSPDAKSAGDFLDAMSNIYATVQKSSNVDEAGQMLFDQVSTFLKPQLDGDRLVISFKEEDLLGGLLGMLQPVADQGRVMRGRRAATRQLQTLAKGLVEYHSSNQAFPAAVGTSADGKPLLSWRVAILPHIGHEELYREFHLDEPWDSPHNRALITKMPKQFACPESHVTEEGRTVYLAPRGEGAVFSGESGTRLQDVTDGAATTLLLVEVDDDHAAIWTKPDDWQFDPKNPTVGLGNHFGEKFLAAFCDGRTRSVERTLSPDVLNALITRAGGEVVNGP